MNIGFSLTNVAGTAVAPVDASSTLSAGGAGGSSVFAGVVVAEKGKPFELLRVTKANVTSLLGYPYRPIVGALSQSMRCVHDALDGGDGFVVRVVPSTAKFPILKVRAIENGKPLNATVANTMSFSEKITLGKGDLMAFYPVDGSTLSRSLSMMPVKDRPTFFNLTLSGADKLGNQSVEHEWLVSSDREALDDNGNSAFVCDVLERTNAPIQAKSIESVDFDPTQISGFAKTMFVGATSGNVNDIKAADWTRAIQVLSNAMQEYTAVVTLGLTDPDIVDQLASVADSRRIDMFADVDGTSWANAVKFMSGAAYDHERMSAYFYPYFAKDPFYDSKAHWGLSGVAFNAKAKGVLKSVGAVGGWHYAGAGVERGIIKRKMPIPFDGLDQPNLEDLYKVRINRLDLAPSGVMMIGDSITCRQKEDELRFQHVNSVLNAISRDFNNLAKQTQHDPDDLTHRALQDGLTSILDGYVSSRALVTPRDPRDGKSPYTIVIEQVSMDLWSVKWSVCVTGTSRRIIGSPVLYR